ncbi:MAG TPA: hypothetical protein VEJ42_06790 [Streptosporangiaceae bacterium]|nr:hypothetical protein [Streptosporangiaceae bacterium]
MAQCVTCGAELHPERAVKYDYCTAPDCQQRNLKGLTMVAVGMNKAADEYLILDEHTQQDMASGKYRDQRRGLFGSAAALPGQPSSQSGGRAATPAGSAVRPARRRGPSRPRPADRRAWTPSQERLALLYNSQGLRPAEIAAKLGVSSHLVTQIILAARNRGKS